MTVKFDRKIIRPLYPVKTVDGEWVWFLSRVEKVTPFDDDWGMKFKTRYRRYPL